jgi:6-phosphogluconolactonase (cycloisomerase 2 family)
VTDSAAGHQTDPSWIAVTNDGLYAYTANTDSGSVSRYSAGLGGKLTLMNQTAASIGSNSLPADTAISIGARALYVLGPGIGVIKGFAVSVDGSLTSETSVTGMPASASGLAAR